MPLSSGTQLGPYTIAGILGAGGMGEVYRARDERLGRDVAIKILPPRLAQDAGAVARFEQESRAVAALSHPNILAIHDVGRDGEVAYAVMELLDGQTLRDALAAGPLPLRKALEYALAIAQGLSAAHAKGIVHRDIKPENVFVTRDGHVKVLDFGLAKVDARGASSDQTTMAAKTDPGTVLGTVGYLSPEQAQGRAADERSDIFSFGAVLYELSTGRRAFSAGSTIDTLHRIVHDQPAPIDQERADAPQELKWVLAKCLAKDPDERYQSARDLVVDLRGVLRTLDSSPRLAQVAPAAIIKKGGGNWRRGAVAAALVIAALAAGAYWRSSRAITSAVVPANITIDRITSSGDVIDAFISPDAKYIVHAVSRSGMQGVWIRQLATASALELVPAAHVGIWGASFSPDGSSIYYVIRGAGYQDGGLFRISTLGGTPRFLLHGLDSKAVFAPDGKHIAFSRADFPQNGESSLMVADADGTNVRTVTTVKPPNFFAPIFFGAPAWSTDGTLVSAPIEHHGTAEPGSFVAYRASDGAPQPFPSLSFPAVGQLAWMPDGSSVVVVAGKHGSSMARDNKQLWMVSYPGGAIRPITNDLFDYRDVSISSDGSAIVTVAADSTATLWNVPLDGGDARSITSGKYDGDDGISVMPDGRILYTSVSAGPESIWIVGPDGASPRQITTEGTASVPLTSPDGRSFYYLRNGSKLWKAGVDGQGAREIASVPGLNYAVLTPDGQWVYFTSSSQGQERLWKVATDGNSVPVIALDGFASRPAISPDGKQIALFYNATATDGRKLAVLSIDGSRQPIKVFDAYQWSWSCAKWTADGKALLHNSAPNDRSNVWLQLLDGSAPKKITRFVDQQIFSFDRSADGKRLVIARGTLSRDAMLIRNFR